MSQRDIKERFDEKWTRSSDGCWVWSSAIHPRTRKPVFSIGGRTYPAVHVAYGLYVDGDPLLRGRYARCLCGEKLCVNPEHYRVRPPVGSVEDRFWSYVKCAGANECWVWTGARNPLGYGRFQTGAGVVTASRFALELKQGPLPTGHGALHHCDNPPCVNPRHLYAGTQADNVADMMRRGRHATQKESA